MSGSWRRRFWQEATVTEEPGGFGVALDGRAVRTPAKAPFLLPSRALAEEVAREFDAQGGEIRPDTMPFFLMCNAALDNMEARAAEVREMLAEYARTDLVCHRAPGPEGLQEAQRAAWDPLVDWLAETRGARLVLVEGVLPAEQPEAAIAAVRDWLAGLDRFELMAAHDLVTLSGSMVIGMAVAEGRIDADAGWAASRVDEAWQAAQWGEDAEAQAAAAHKGAAFARAANLMIHAREARHG